MKRNKHFVLGMAVVVLSLLLLGGCASTRVQEYETVIPIAERCIVVNSRDTPLIYWGEDFVSFLNPLGYEVDKVLVPAGKQTVHVVESGYVSIDIARVRTGIGSPYFYARIPLEFVHTTEYDFKPGMSYAFRVNNRTGIVYDYERNQIVVKRNGVVIEVLDPADEITYYPPPEDLEIIELGMGMGSVYIGPTAGPVGIVGAWDYSPSFLPLGGGYAVGLELIHDSFEMRIAGEAAGYIAFAYPNLKTPGGFAGYNLGGSVLFAAHNRVEFYGLGGGIAGGIVADFDDGSNNHTFSSPYIEAMIWGFYFRYYLHDADWYNKFAIGAKAYL